MIRSQSRRYIAISNYVLFAVVALRAVLTYGSHAVLAPLLVLLAIFLLLLVAAPHITQRWAAFRWIYFVAQTALVVAMGFLVPSFDFLWVLFIILAGQACRSCSITLPVASSWSRSVPHHGRLKKRVTKARRCFRNCKRRIRNYRITPRGPKNSLWCVSAIEWRVNCTTR